MSRLNKIKQVFEEYLEDYEERVLLEDRYSEFVEGEEPDGSDSIDSVLLEYTARRELSYAISEAPSYMDDVDLTKAREYMSDIIGEASADIEALRGKLPATQPMYRVINAMVSEMDKQEQAHGWRDATLAFETASENKAFQADFHKIILGDYND